MIDLKPVFNEFVIDGVKGMNIFWYTEEIQGVLYQLKGCNDYELKDIFLDYYLSWLRSKYKGYLMVPAPSSKEANQKRGFNQVNAIFEKLNLKIVDCFEKVRDFKQHELTSEERKNVGKLIEIKNLNLKGKSILLVDDVFTTGSTMKTMISLIKKLEPKRIRVLVMAKTIDLDQRT